MFSFFLHSVWYFLCHSLYSVLYSMHFSTDQQLEKMLGEGAVGVSIGDVAGFQDVEEEVFLYF